MYVNREKLLQCLPPYADEWITVADNQTVPDIINEVLTAHKDFAPYYDKIALYFDCDTVEETANTLQQFCEDNIKYNEESEDDQTTALPTGILTRGFGDCKHYSSFCGGILSALQRTGKKIDWNYRFASYKLLNPTPHHVFIVVKDRDTEYWIDPTPHSNKKIPYWYTDKKVKPGNMALRRNIAGFDDIAGQSQPVNAPTNEYIIGENIVPAKFYDGIWWFRKTPATTIGQFETLIPLLLSASNAGAGGSSAPGTGSTAGSGMNPISIIQNLSSVIQNLFGSTPCSSYEHFVQMFPVTNPNDANSVLQTLQGFYQHYLADTKAFSSDATRCVPEAYGQYFTELITQYNRLAGGQAITMSQTPPGVRYGKYNIVFSAGQPNTSGTYTPGLTTTTPDQTQSGPDLKNILLIGGGAILAAKALKLF